MNGSFKSTCRHNIAVIVLLAISCLAVSSMAQTKLPGHARGGGPLESIAGVGSDILQHVPLLSRHESFVGLGHIFSTCVIRNEDSPYWCIVYNIETQQYVAFTSGDISGMPVLVESGDRFLIPTMSTVDGVHHTYRLFDFDNNVAHQQRLRGRLEATESGKYYTASHGVDFAGNTPPNILDSSLNILDFGPSSQASADWHAATSGDSLYVFMDFNQLKLFDLHSQKLLKSIGYISPSQTLGVTGFFCNENATYCAVCSPRNTVIINTVSSEWTDISATGSQGYISPDGTRVYVVELTKTHLRVTELVMQNGDFQQNQVREISSLAVVPGVKVVLIYSVFEFANEFIINFLARVSDAEPKGQARSLALSLGERTNPQVRLLGGPSWVHTTDTSRILYTLDIFSNPGTVTIHETVDSTWNPYR